MQFLSIKVLFCLAWVTLISTTALILVTKYKLVHREDFESDSDQVQVDDDNDSEEEEEEEEEEAIPPEEHPGPYTQPEQIRISLGGEKRSRKHDKTISKSLYLIPSAKIDGRSNKA